MTVKLPGAACVRIFLRAQFYAHKIINQQVQFTCLLSGLTPEVAGFVHDALEKPSTTHYDDIKFAILELVEETKLEHSKWLLGQFLNEQLNEDSEGPQPQERYCRAGTSQNGHRLSILHNNRTRNQVPRAPCYFAALDRQTNSEYLKLAQHKGQTSPPSKAVKPSKAIQHKLSKCLKTLQTAGILQTSESLCVIILSKRIKTNAAINPELE
ncbi:hypothetical protein ACTXT7_002225 [Hymenolepis weldensis]